VARESSAKQQPLRAADETERGIATLRSTRELKALSKVVTDYYDCIDKGDVSAALSHFSSNSVYRRPGYETFVGLASIKHYYDQVRIVDTGRHDIESLIEGRTEVAVRGSMVGRSTDGKSLNVRFADFWRFHDDLVIERNTYFDAAAV
jgi:ketosteroid isomerase-like protein